MDKLSFDPGFTEECRGEMVFDVERLSEIAPFQDPDLR
jgi:hypothetical protein